jgi:hypothetical protein
MRYGVGYPTLRVKFALAPLTVNVYLPAGRLAISDRTLGPLDEPTTDPSAARRVTVSEDARVKARVAEARPLPTFSEYDCEVCFFERDPV